MAEHRLKIKMHRGALTLDVALELKAGWTMLFGPSGCGKTTLLRAIAGLEQDGQVEVSRRERGGEWSALDGLPPQQRGISYAPQGGGLFPHMTVAKNVAFGFDVCREPGHQVKVIDIAMEMFTLRSMTDRLPRELSGGETQRVNLARAFAKPGARWMLLDEPFAGMDRARRDALLPPMKAWAEERDVAVLSVTHDVDEAFLLGADVVQMDAGRVVAQGDAAGVLGEERERMLRTLGRITHPFGLG